MENSKIEWTDHTFNPVIGCTKVSDGCTHCYAESMENRWGRGWGPTAPRRRTSTAYWKKPIAWNKDAAETGVRQRVFCASMSDVGEDVSDWIVPRRDLSIIIEQTPHLDWLLLTKRPENLNRLFARWNGVGGWPPNVWAGTSVENQGRADLRIPELLKVPAAVRFLSVEPMIEGITFRPTAHTVNDMLRLAGSGDAARPMMLHGIHWVIVGGESGQGARPMDPAWARYIRDQAKEAGVAFFMKQMGGSFDKKGQLEDLPPDLRVREWPKTGLTV